MKLVRPWLVSSITYSLAILLYNSTMITSVFLRKSGGRVYKWCGVEGKETERESEKKNYSNDDHNGLL